MTHEVYSADNTQKLHERTTAARGFTTTQLIKCPTAHSEPSLSSLHSMITTSTGLKTCKAVGP